MLQLVKYFFCTSLCVSFKKEGAEDVSHWNSDTSRFCKNYCKKKVSFLITSDGQPRSSKDEEIVKSSADLKKSSDTKEDSRNLVLKNDEIFDLNVSYQEVDPFVTDDVSFLNDNEMKEIETLSKEIEDFKNDTKDSINLAVQALENTYRDRLIPERKIIKLRNETIQFVYSRGYKGTHGMLIDILSASHYLFDRLSVRQTAKLYNKKYPRSVIKYIKKLQNHLTTIIRFFNKDTYEDITDTYIIETYFDVEKYSTVFLTKMSYLNVIENNILSGNCRPIKKTSKLGRHWKVKQKKYSFIKKFINYLVVLSLVV